MCLVDSGAVAIMSKTRASLRGAWLRYVTQCCLAAAQGCEGLAPRQAVVKPLHRAGPCVKGGGYAGQGDRGAWQGLIPGSIKGPCQWSGRQR